ncbi:MAG: protease modulator HflC [Paracoccaceae bacterium]
MRWLPIGLGAGVVALVIVLASVFIVDEREQGLVLQFGEVVRVADEPGLYLMVPFIQEVEYYEDRILPVETSELEVTPADERRLIVDAFARWRIVDVVRFRQSVQTEFSARQRLGQILNDSLRQVLGSVPQSDVLSPERTVLMQRIRDVSREQALAFGVEVIDVRIRRADLPEQNLQATFDRMEAERQREAADERARGMERAQELRAAADREATEIVSDAQRRAEEIRGQADAERNAVFAEAFSRDPEFFAFYRSLTAYERSLRGDNSTLVISPNSEFFDYLKSDAPAGITPGPAAFDGGQRGSVTVGTPSEAGEAPAEAEGGTQADGSDAPDEEARSGEASGALPEAIADPATEAE